MKKKIFKLIMVLIIFSTFTGCNKVVTEEDNYNQTYGKLEGPGTFTQMNSINEKISTFPYESYFRFYPFEYKDGEVKGIISNQHKDFSINYNQSILYTSASPILYKEYKASLDGDMEETGKIIDPVSRGSIENLNIIDPYQIKLRDNSSNKEYIYTIKKDLGLKLRKDDVYQDDIYVDNNDESVYKSVTIDSISDRYQLIKVIYQKYNEVNVDIVGEITVILDKNSSKFYEGEFDSNKYNLFSGGIKEINNELYLFSSDKGEISKLILEGEIIKAESYFSLNSKKDEVYYFDGVIGNPEIGYSVLFSKTVNQNNNTETQVSQGLVNITNKKVSYFDKAL